MDQAQRFVVVSADSHAGAKSLRDYEPYVDPAFRDRLAELYDRNTELRLPGMIFGVADPEVHEADPIRRDIVRLMLRWGLPDDEVYRRASHYSLETIEGGGDFSHRLELTEQHGVAGEVYNPGPAVDGVVPPLNRLYGTKFRTSLDRDFTLAMKRTYHRWLADLCNAAPGRRAGVMQVDFSEMDEAIATVRWGRDAGLFGGVALPIPDGTFDLPSYADPEYWEPLWNVLQELNIPAYVHAGGEAPDGASMYGPDPVTAWEIGSYEFWYFARRVFWMLTFGGVFDRHPDLKLVIAENNAAWVPGVLQEMESHLDVFFHLPASRKLKARPTDYFLRHCYLGASILTRQEVGSRHQIGIDNLCWGSDFPHPEGAGPYVRSVLAYQLGGLPTDEIEKILGSNALKVWDFDQHALRQAAARIGPTYEELSAHPDRADIPDTFCGVMASQPVTLEGRSARPVPRNQLP